MRTLLAALAAALLALSALPALPLAAAQDETCNDERCCAGVVDVNCGFKRCFGDVCSHGHCHLWVDLDPGTPPPVNQPFSCVDIA